MQDPLLLANQLLNIGSSFQAKGELDKAISYLTKSQQHYRLAKFGSGEGKALFNLANVYLSLSQEQQAVEYYQKAKEIFIKYEMQGYALIAKHQIATTSIHLGRVKYAESELNLIIQSYKKIGDLQGELTAEIDLIYASIAKLDYQEAVARAEAILSRVLESEFSYLELHIRRMATAAYLRLNQLENAERHFSFYKEQWKDIRPGFAFIPAHMVQTRGNLSKALEMANQIKTELGEKWTERHEKILVQFKQSVRQNKVIPILY